MMEEKLIKGGEVISKASKQEGLLRKAEQELRERQQQEARLARELAEKEEANLQLEGIMKICYCYTIFSLSPFPSYLSVFFSLSLFLFPSFYLFFSLSFSFSPSLLLSHYLSLSVSFSFSLSLDLSLSISAYSYRSFYLSLSFSFSLYTNFYFPVCLSLSHFISLQYRIIIIIPLNYNDYPDFFWLSTPHLVKDASHKMTHILSPTPFHPTLHYTLHYTLLYTLHSSLLQLNNNKQKNSHLQSIFRVFKRKWKLKRKSWKNSGPSSKELWGKPRIFKKNFKYVLDSVFLSL